MSGRLFKRGARLTLSKPFTEQRGGRFGSFFAVQPNGIEIGGADLGEGALRFSFQIEKNIQKQPNDAEIKIYNLSAEHRALFGAKPLHVRLDVGYDGDLERLFVGDLRWADQQKDSVTWETVLSVGDGERAYKHALVNRSFKPGVSRREVANEAIRAMGLEAPAGMEGLSGMLDQFAGGFSMEGPAHRELSRALEPTGAEWSVQDGRLQVLRDGDVRADQAVLVTPPPTGRLVGVPEYGPSKEKGKPAKLKLKMLLEPGLTPGGLIQVNSLGVKGLFKVVRIVHAGDTEGAAWHSEIEAVAR